LLGNNFLDYIGFAIVGCQIANTARMFALFSESAKLSSSELSLALRLLCFACFVSRVSARNKEPFMALCCSLSRFVLLYVSLKNRNEQATQGLFIPRKKDSVCRGRFFGFSLRK
jgi:hypothetical protein